MKIVMLGHSGAGKTTYVSLMYHAMQSGVGGFTVSAEKGKHHRRLLDDATEIMQGRYPDPTHQRTSYKLVLEYDDEEVLPFRWRDYRGGALSDRSDSDDVTELHDDLVAADGIVVLVDAVELSRNPRALRDVRRLVTLVLPALSAREEVYTPFVIGFTKCDLVDLDGPGVADALTDPFEPLVKAISRTQHIHGTFLPLACGPQPQNVVLPVLWALRFGVIGRAMRLHAAVEQAEERARYAYANDTLLDRFISPFKGERSWREIADEHRAVALQEQQRLMPLLEPAERLAELLEEMSGF